MEKADLSADDQPVMPQVSSTVGRLLALILAGHKRADAARAAGSPKREAFAAGTGKRCATGCTATMRMAWQA